METNTGNVVPSDQEIAEIQRIACQAARRYGASFDEAQDVAVATCKKILRYWDSDRVQAALAGNWTAYISHAAKASYFDLIRSHERYRRRCSGNRTQRRHRRFPETPVTGHTRKETMHADNELTFNRGLVDLISKALDNDTIPAGRMNRECSQILKDLSQQGMAYQAHEGPFAGTIITNRSRPEFLIVPIAHTPEYLQALAGHTTKQAAAATSVDSETFVADLLQAIDQAD